MRTTLSLDEDVARMLEQFKKSKEASFKQIVNDALRKGLTEMSQPTPTRSNFKTRAVDLGKSSFPNLDNAWEVIAEAEGDWHK
jgi:hypothetical protein